MNVIIEKKRKNTIGRDIKIVSWNLDIDNLNIDIKMNELLARDADVLMLQECSEGIKYYLDDYVSFGSAKTHCGNAELFLHNRINPQLIKIFVNNGMIVYHIKSEYGQLILGSLHLPPYGGLNDKILRTYLINKLIVFLKKEKLLDMPIIIGGDTNMRDEEQITELTDNLLDDIYEKFGDEEKYHTWPNKTSTYKNKFHKYKNFRFDRFFFSHVSSSTFNTILSDNSDHLMIETSIQFKKSISDSINAKLHKIIEYRHKKYINDYIDEIIDEDNNQDNNQDNNEDNNEDNYNNIIIKL